MKQMTFLLVFACVLFVYSDPSAEDTVVFQVEQPKTDEIPNESVKSNRTNPLDPYRARAIAYGLAFQKKLFLQEETLTAAKTGISFLTNNYRGTSSNPALQQLIRNGLVATETTRYATIQTNPSFEDFLDFQIAGVLKIDLKGSPLQALCRAIPKCLDLPKIAGIEYRRPDGACNNRLAPQAGMATSSFFREILSFAYYDDLLDHERTLSVDRVTKLPGARLLSVKLNLQQHQTDPKLNLLFMQMGQFIAHDFTEIVTFRPPQKVEAGAGFDCCSPNILAGGTLRHPECFSIQVPEDDPFYSQFGVKCLNFLRAAPVPPWDCAAGTREQMNAQTAYIDLSSLYGSDEDRVNGLRSFTGGRLIESRINASFYPPMYNIPNECSIPQSSKYSCFKSGDDRGNMHVQLVSLHVIYIRVHNQLASNLQGMNPHWNDERVFQETRRLLSAIQQHITYGEHLPLLIGPDVMQQHDLYPRKEGFYQGYSALVEGATGLAVSTAAYRLHNQIVGRLDLYRKMNNKKIPQKNGEAHLKDTFFNPSILYNRTILDAIVNGMMFQPMSFFDRFMDHEVTQQLFHGPGKHYGTDLAAIDIQRGRDVGLSGFNSWINFCGFTKYINIDDMTRDGDFDEEFVKILKGVFVNVDDIDFWLAGMNEKVVPGGSVGRTFACVIGSQFARLKRGDRFWYENPMPGIAFSASQLTEIRKMTMARIICAGGDDITVVPLNAFLYPSDQNPLVSCNDFHRISAIDLSPWKDLQLTDNYFNMEAKDHH